MIANSTRERASSISNDHQFAYPQAIPFPDFASLHPGYAHAHQSIVSPAFWISGTQRLISDWT
jgi:hypothetical protein